MNNTAILVIKYLESVHDSKPDFESGLENCLVYNFLIAENAIEETYTKGIVTIDDQNIKLDVVVYKESEFSNTFKRNYEIDFGTKFNIDIFFTLKKTIELAHEKYREKV